MGGSNSTFGKSTTAEQAINGLDLTGKYCLITGCNTGIGKETARVLLKQNAHIIMACRSVDKAQEARKEIIDVVKADSEFKGNKDDLEKQITVEELDLGSLNSVKTFSEKFLSSNLPLHYLINNAGVMAIQDWQPTKDGIEMQFGTNHIGHFYLTTLLTPKLIASKPSRVIVVSSAAHRYAPASFPTWVDKHYKKTEGPDKESYGAFPNYGISKAANILFAREYNKRYFSQGVTAVSLHPGVIATELTRNLGSFKSTVFKTLGKPFFKSIPQGAATTVRCVSLTDSEIKPGGYYADCQDASDSLRADIKESNDSSPTSEEKLWTLSEKLIEKSLGSSNNVVPVSNNSNNIEEVKQN